MDTIAEEGSSSSSVSSTPVALEASNSKVFEAIRNAEANQRCKKLLWHACKNALPVKAVMQQKGMIEDSVMCPFCGTCEETTTHAFLLCEEARNVWFGSSLGLRVDLLQKDITMLQWLDDCVDMMDKKHMGLLCCIVWALWFKRNSWVMNGKKLDFEDVMAKVKSVSVLEGWAPPKEPYLKANFASSVRELIGTGIGVIFRNSQGLPMASATNFLVGDCFEREVAETLAYKCAVEKSKELCFVEAIYETECNELHTQWGKLTAGSITKADYLSDLLIQCRSVMHGMEESSLALVGPTANNVAQYLAVLAFEYGEKVWIEEVPNEAVASVASDSAAIANFAEDDDIDDEM